MTTLVVGATGATGQLVVKQLLANGEFVKVVVRSSSGLPAALANHEHLQMTKADVLALPTPELVQLVQGCHSIVCCLGHTLSLGGIYGHPRRLVTDAVTRLHEAVIANEPATPIKFVLMNTAGNQNRDIAESLPLSERLVLRLLRKLLPPHVDNEDASDYLRLSVGQNNSVMQWVVVRPDSLTNEEMVSEYIDKASPVRSAIFNAGKVSRTNVGDFMARLVGDVKLWNRWQGQMPVLYNAEYAE